MQTLSPFLDALSQGTVAVTFRKVTDHTNRTMIATRHPDAIAEHRLTLDSRPNLVVIEMLPSGTSRIRSLYPSEILGWCVASIA
jgi:hypothetical protein